MFKIILNSGESFTANAVQENYTPPHRSDGENPILNLAIEATPVSHPLNYYREMLEKSNALNTITVQLEETGEIIDILKGYNVIDSLSQRFLITGEKSLTMLLTKRSNESQEVQDI